MFFLDSSSGLEHLAGLLRAFGMLYAALVAEQSGSAAEYFLPEYVN